MKVPTAQHESCFDPSARSRAWAFFDVAQRLAMWVPGAWLFVTHGLFVLTALMYREWPHPPGFYRDAEHLANDPLVATHPNNPFIGYCHGTFDPKGFGLIYDVSLWLFVVVPLTTIAWIPLSCVVGFTLGRPQAKRQALYLVSCALLVLTVTTDPVGVWDWYID